MADTDTPQSEEDLIEMLQHMKLREYINRYGVDRELARYLHAFGRNQTEMLISNLLDLANKEYSTEKEKVVAFIEAMNELSENSNLRTKLIHSSLNAR